MSSYIMHMCVSDIVKRKLNLTDKFIYGSILPDILKMATGDRQGSHFLEKTNVGDYERNLPVIDKAIKELDIEDFEIKLGYIAHLVEDLIWFNDFIPTFAKKLENNKYMYLQTGEVKSGQDFTKDIYSDYANCGAHVIQNTNTDMDALKKSVSSYITEDNCLNFMLENTEYTKISDLQKNHFMTKECIDKYIERTTKAVEKIVLELMGE